MTQMLMKGHTLTSRKGKEVYPLIAEVKEDEIRCRVLVDACTGAVTYRSFAEKPLFNLERHDSMWQALANTTGVFEYDTGIMVNENFNDTYRWVRSSKNRPVELENAPHRFILFDLPQCALPYSSVGSDMSRVACVSHIILLWARGGWRNAVITRPFSRLVPDLQSLMAMYSEARDAGHEGLMAKTPGHLYQRKRTADWLKVKPSEDADGVIISLHEAVSDTDDASKGLYKGKPLGRIGSVTMRMEDGSMATPHGIKHDLGREMYLDPQKFIHRWGEMSYMERDRQGGYRHPVFNRIREDKA